MQTTALTQTHINMGAKMVPFAGFNMPVQYSNLIEEHMAVRNAVGMFDVSHMGEFRVHGEGALELLQWVCSNDISKLVDGKVLYSCLPNDKGGIVDDLLVYRMAENDYFLVVNASNIDKDWNWIKSQNRFGAKMENLSDSYSLLAVQGPKAIETLQVLTQENLAEIPYYNFTVGTIAGINEVIISNTGYTGAGGFELYVKNEAVQSVWDAVLQAGESKGIKPCGLGCRDTLRLEMGFCLYGNDINDETSPLEAGLGWVTKFNKDFVNSQALKQQKEAGVNKKLVGWVIEEKGGIPRHDYPVVDPQGNQIGVVTSGTMSPSLGIALGLAYVPTALSEVGSKILIQVRNKTVEATVTKPPFLKK
ncbi:MAG: glycine cleavage system aminomethyltransferase GcvT [Luteibaculaceae bacterium]